MDLTTKYLGLELPHPLVLGASPLVDDLGAMRRAEDAGAAAIVMHSLFEEQISSAHHAELALSLHEQTFAEALDFRPATLRFALGPDEYLEQIRRLKGALHLPVIGSLNGVTNQGWLEYARLIEQAGADALELNVYRVAADPSASAEDLERTTVEMLANVKEQTRLPVAVKLSPFHTSLAHFATRLTNAGTDGLVLFNRFYQPSIDPEELEVSHRIELSTSAELPLRLRWLGILSAQLQVSLAASGGVHSVLDAVKAVMAGAHAVQLVSEILHRGVRRFSELRAELAGWLESHGYDSLGQARGNMNLARCPAPAAYERANYLRVLEGFSREP